MNLWNHVEELNRTINSIFSKVVDDISPVEWDVLLLLVESDINKPGEIAKATNESPDTITRVLDKLEKLGYVERLIDPNDRRGVIIRLLDPKPVREKVLEQKAQLEQLFSSHQVLVLQESLTKLKRELGHLLNSLE